VSQLSGKQVAFLAAGLGLLAWAFWGLAFGIPHGPREFTYPISLAWPPLFSGMNGFTPEQLSSHVLRVLVLGGAVSCMAVAVTGLRAPSVPHGQLPLARLVVLGSLLLATVAWGLILRGTPLQDDESTYLYQAHQLAQLRLADPLEHESFAEPFTIFTPLGATGKYLFGLPLLLVPGVLVGLPQLGVFAALVVALWAFYRWLGLVAPQQQRLRLLALAGLGLSPAFTLTSATMTSQTPALAACLLAAWGLGTRSARGELLAGLALGFAFTVRLQFALPVGVALVLAQTGLRPAAWLRVVLGALPWLLAVFIYDTALMGAPLKLPWDGYAITEHYGFGRPQGPQGSYEHTPWRALVLAGIALVRLNGWGLGWPLSLAGPVLWFGLGRPSRALVTPWAWVALATFLFQAGYYSLGPSETGAAYHFACLPFIAAATAASLEALQGHRLGSYALSWALVATVLGTGSFYVEQADRLFREARAISGPRDELEAELETDALVVEDFLLPAPAWVFGPPRRDRRPDSPVVYYPRSAVHALLKDPARFAKRRCVFLWFDWVEGQYRHSSCADFDRIVEKNDPAFEANRWRQPQYLAPHRPWFADGHWREAFAWLPF
jgi:hypothetical protein